MPKEDEHLPAGPPVPEPTWECEGCTAAFVWQKRVTSDQPSEIVHDRSPFTIRVNGRSFSCCTRECARNVWFVKSLEMVSDKFLSLYGPPKRKRRS